MLRDATRSGMRLALAGLLAGLFFWVTDIRFGLAAVPAGMNYIDAVGQTLPGTIAGLAGSAVIFLLGLGLMIRRPL